jgi:glycosyltransferase involved in cell wall biosynthesis
LPHLPPQARTRLVPNPIEIERLPAVDVTRNREVVMIGRLAPEKGPRLLAQAAKATGVPVRFIGDGPEAAALRAMDPDAAFSAGWVDRAGVLAALDQARALVLPSVLYETQGLVVSEAMARGVPVIVSDGCAARDAVVPGETGLLFRSGDAADLARQLSLLDDERVGKMGRAAYARYWAAPQTPATYLEQVLAVFQETLAALG